MVAISLYRGNLHKPPDTPRKWLMPARNISLKDFRTLLARRDKTPRNDPTTPDTKAHAFGVFKGKQVDPYGASEALRVQIPGSDPTALDKGCDGSGSSKGLSNLDNGFDGSGNLTDSLPVVENASNGLESSKGPVIYILRNLGTVAENAIDASGNLASGFEAVVEKGSNSDKGIGGPGSLKELQVDIRNEGVNSDAEKSNKVEPSMEKEKRKQAIEEELKVMSERKHNLVQALKQILQVEEELKRRNAMQGSAARPHQLQIEIPNDSGSMTPHTATKLGSGPNNAGVAAGTEGDYTPTQNVHSRHLLRTSSVSPSSESLRRPAFSQHNVVPHPTRASLGVSESPSRFAPTPTGQGHSTNLPVVSASGTNYIASSPSPVASGGTSVFRDSRLPSPWN